MSTTNDSPNDGRRTEPDYVPVDGRVERPAGDPVVRPVGEPVVPVDSTGRPVDPADRTTTPPPLATEPTNDGRSVRQNVVAREKEEFGGFKFGSAFFGWLTATGTVVLLTALVAGAGAALGLGTASPDEVSDAAEQNAETIGIVGAIAVLVILLIAYYCGGYVAGRMARFSGAKQGLAVWLWAVVIAIVVAIIGALAGGQYNVLSNLDTFPRIPIDEGDLTAGGIITAVLAVVVSLAGAVLGGLGGMRYHRKVDRAGLGK
jgi:hypothetical protein